MGRGCADEEEPPEGDLGALVAHESWPSLATEFAFSLCALARHCALVSVPFGVETRLKSLTGCAMKSCLARTSCIQALNEVARLAKIQVHGAGEVLA